MIKRRTAMKNFKLQFEITEMPFYAVSLKNNRKTFEIQAFDDEVLVTVQYNFNRRPLNLQSSAKAGDNIEIVMMDHRIELYTNGELMDEEWPKGNCLFDRNDSFTPRIKIVATDYTEPDIVEPSVIGHIENAEGWCPGNGVFVGDCMPYTKDDEYHVLYLKDRHHHFSKWELGAHQWAHISTKDFKTWDIHPMAVPITDQSESSICTGSWIRHGNKEYLYYTIRKDFWYTRIPAPISRSVSYDGYHFEKDKDFGFHLPDKYDAAIARDPKVVKGEDGLYHMFLTTVLVEENKGCLAHYVSADMEKWEETTPIYIAEDNSQPECPDYFAYNGKYYLVFSIGGKAHYMISDKPFEGFEMRGNATIPCSNVPKASEWKGRLIFTGYKPTYGYAGTMTFTAATANEDGELIFEKL